MISAVVLLMIWLLGCWTGGNLASSKKEEKQKEPISDSSALLDEFIAEQIKEAVAKRLKREPVWPNELEFSSDERYIDIALFECISNEKTLVGRIKMTRAQAVTVVEKIVARF